MFDTIAEITPYVRHVPSCAIYRCGRTFCRLPVDDDLHHQGTADSHPFEQRACDCGREDVLARIADALRGLVHSDQR